MNKLASYIAVRPIVAIVAGIMLVSGILVSSICATWEGDGFAIYLTKQDVPPAQMEALSHVNLADQPIISIKDVITYNAQTHEIKLTEEAFERLSQLDVSTAGKSFVVCVDKAPIYWGAFWTCASSMSFDGVTILTEPLGLEEPCVIRLELGYPYSFYTGEDPRSNPLVMESLEQAGKLINDEGFGIYLTKQDIPPAQMEALSHVNLADQPIISIKDVITYDAQAHEIRLTEEAFERISQLDVSTAGKSFIVCIDKAPVYWGAFWVGWSCTYFDGVTIWMPLSLEEPHVIRIELPEIYTGEDPRSNALVMASLEQAGKLINKPSITPIEELPRSFKGYELYSWEEEDQWHFTLITGTNRIKTMEEITSEGDSVSETGWVKIHVVGADAIQDVLSRLPEGESVFWCDELHIGQLTETDLQLPPQQIADAIEEYAKQCGLDFVVTVQRC